MKKLIIYFFILILPISIVNAECKISDEIITYQAGDYGSEPYCVNMTSSRNNLRSSGCFALSIASILKNYGQDVDPTDIRDWLCTNFPNDTQSRTYGSILASTSFENAFNMQIEDIPDTIEALDQALSENKAVLASINSTSVYTSGTHYVVVMKKEGDNYYVINTGNRSVEAKRSDWRTRSHVITNVVNAKNNGLWSVTTNKCSGSYNVKSNRKGTLVDPFESFPLINGGGTEGSDPFTCETILINSDGTEKLLKKILDGIFIIMQIAAPIMALALSITDYTKAIIGDEKSVKKANLRTIKRVVIAVIILLLLFLLELLFNLFGLYDLNTCL